MNNNTLILVAALGAVFLMSRKAAAAKPTTAPTAPIGGMVGTNVNNQLWTAVLGGAWKSLVTPEDQGSSNFLMRNSFGQVVSSDGKPVDSVYSDISDAISGGDYTAPDGTNLLATMGW
jgi:hypothetical protein